MMKKSDLFISIVHKKQTNQDVIHEDIIDNYDNLKQLKDRKFWIYPLLRNGLRHVYQMCINFIIEYKTLLLYSTVFTVFL